MNESVLINFGQFIGMEADELAAMDTEDRQLLLKKLLACQLAPHEPEVAQYICANLDFDGVQQMHEQTQGECWTLGKHDPLPPAVLHDIFTNAALVDKNNKNEAYQRFKEKIGTGVEDARALKLFHALHLPNLRAIVLHTVDNDIVKANELHDKLLYYKREVEGPKRMVIREELNDLLVAGISFDPKVFSCAAEAAQEEQPPRAEVVPLVKVVPIASEVQVPPSWSDGDESELRGVLKPFYKLAGLPLNFPARDAAKQFVLLTRSSEVPDSVLEPLLHRDQMACRLREKFAQHIDESHRDTLYQKAMEPVASAIFASPAGEANIAENAMCLHFYNTLPKDERKQEYTAKQFFSKFFIENEQPVGKYWIKQIADAKF